MKDKGKEKPRSCHTLWDTRDMTAKGNVGARTRENQVEENTGETRIRSVDKLYHINVNFFVSVILCYILHLQIYIHFTNNTFANMIFLYAKYVKWELQFCHFSA